MYLALKTVHILAVVVFLGNIITGVFWKMQADRTRNPATMATALEGIIRSDRFFTMPGVVLILVTGFGMAAQAGYPVLGTGWIFWSLVLFAVSGLISMLWVAPQQRRLLALARAESLDEQAYGRLSRQWALSGTLATLTPLLALVLMVLKPALPGFGG